MSSPRPSPTARKQVFRELLSLIAAGLSPVQALDYWVTEDAGETFGKLSQTEWARHRNRTAQSISYNVSQAREVLESPRTDIAERLDRKAAGAGETPDVDIEFPRRFDRIIEQDDRNHDRVVDDPFCPSCGGYHDGDGLCESCSKSLEDDLVADGGWGR